MANKKISQLDALGAAPAATDILPITDVSDTTGSAQGTTKRVTVANLHSGLQAEPAEGAFVDGDKTKLDGLNAADYATASHTHAIDDLSDVDTSTTAPTTNDFLKWGGSNWVPALPTADVDTPLTTALRGTDNPHIGVFPDQSFKVMDNPAKSAMVIADADGNITYLLKGDSAEVRVALGSTGTPVRFALASDLPVFTLENDSGEPDIEVTEPTSGEKISVISGDSDTKGANGLPIRQGYNLPDIGANPAPLLISGGSIA
jgi:hypothetical protein